MINARHVRLLSKITLLAGAATIRPPLGCIARQPKPYRMSASKPRKEVTMKKARLISLTTSLCLLAFYLEGYARGFGRAFTYLGGPVSWFDGH